MHGAPSVSYPVARSRFALGLAAAGWTLAAAALVAWTVRVDAPGWRQAVVAGLLVCSGAVAVRDWSLSPRGVLDWDGTGWTWETHLLREPGHPSSALDLQARLLLLWTPQTGRARWMWVERGASPQRWNALRRAVYSRARTAAPPGAEPR